MTSHREGSAMEEGNRGRRWLERKGMLNVGCKITQPTTYASKLKCYLYMHEDRPVCSIAICTTIITYYAKAGQNWCYFKTIHIQFPPVCTSPHVTCQWLPHSHLYCPLSTTVDLTFCLVMLNLLFFTSFLKFHTF